MLTPAVRRGPGRKEAGCVAQKVLSFTTCKTAVTFDICAFCQTFIMKRILPSALLGSETKVRALTLIN